MTYFADGHRLERLNEILARLAEDPVQFDRARNRYNDPPPPYTSGETTQPPSLISPSGEERQVQETIERGNSRVHEQFLYQQGEEEKQLRDAGRKGELGSGHFDFRNTAHENVKKRWIKQGIWNGKWESLSRALWKHEEPLQVESESESGSEPEGPRSVFGTVPKKSRRPKSDAEKQRIAERRITREREREASRPSHQFTFQISKERERIEDESRSQRPTANVDLHAQAYENVKNRWIEQGIWNSGWGNLPGISWKHEEPREQNAPDGPVLGPADHSHTAGSHFGESVLFGEHHTTAQPLAENPRPLPNDGEVEDLCKEAEITHEARSGVTGGVSRGGSILPRSHRTSQELSFGTEPSRLEASSSESVGEFRRSKNRKVTAKDKRALPATALHTVRSSNVSKVYGKGKRRTPRQSTSSYKVPSDSASSFPKASTGCQELGLDMAKAQPSPANSTVRRSQRISQQKEKLNVLMPGAPVISNTADPADSFHHNARSKPKRPVPGVTKDTSSARPHGISKKKTGRLTRKTASNVRDNILAS